MILDDELNQLFHRVKKIARMVEIVDALKRQYTRDCQEAMDTTDSAEVKRRNLHELTSTMIRVVRQLLHQDRMCECDGKAADTPHPEYGCSPFTIYPSPGPWCAVSAMSMGVDGTAIAIVKDRDGQTAHGLMVFVGPGLNDKILANVALVLSAPMLLREAVYMLDALEAPNGLIGLQRDMYLVDQVEYVIARLRVMVNTATPIRVTPHSDTKGEGP